MTIDTTSVDFRLARMVPHFFKNGITVIRERSLIDDIQFILHQFDVIDVEDKWVLLLPASLVGRAWDS